MNGKTIVVLGGGVGGIVAANELRRLLPDRHRVFVVERKEYHEFAPSFLWVMKGARTPGEVRRPLPFLLRKDIEIVPLSATGIDTGRCSIETNGKKINYDYLIVAVGAELAEDALPGLREGSSSFYSLAGAERLYASLREFSGGSVVIVVSSLPYKCPGAPLEGAMLINDYLVKKGFRDRVKVALYTPEPQPLPVAGPEFGSVAVEMLSSRGIEYHPRHRLLSVDPTGRSMSFDGNRTVPYDLLVAIPPHRCAAVVAASSLAGETGWVPVDPKTLRTNFENVYAIGDVTSLPLPGRWNPELPLSLPKAGVFAHTQGLVVARRIAAEIAGQAADECFCGDGYCMLEAGEDLAGFAYGNFFSEPSPQVNFKRIGKAWHFGKVLFEKMWLSPPGFQKSLYSGMISMGARMYGVPTHLL